jgi:hypothetical protein
VSNAPSKPVSFSRPKVGYFSNRPRRPLNTETVCSNATFRVCIQQSVYGICRRDYNDECRNFRELITGIHGLTAINFDYINI